MVLSLTRDNSGRGAAPVTRRKQKHMDESWAVKANREREELERIESRERLDEMLEEARLNQEREWKEICDRAAKIEMARDAMDAEVGR